VLHRRRRSREQTAARSGPTSCHVRDSSRTASLLAAGLGEIQDGTFARQWLTENNAAGRAHFLAERRIHAEHPIEEVGAELRGMMSWLKDGADLRKD